jgi:hypothetical protein
VFLNLIFSQLVVQNGNFYSNGSVGATVRRKSFSNKEKQIWVIREKKIRAKGNNRKRPCLIQRKNEN